MGVAVTVTGQRVRQEKRLLGKEQYCGGCGIDSDRAESETGKSMIGKGAVLWWVWQ